MATDKQIAANRRNATLSTVPRSLSGIARSSLNAVSHGLTRRQGLMPGESRADFNGIRDAMFSSLLPMGALENQLVERAANLIWRLRRMQGFEVALFQWIAHLEAKLHDHVDEPIDIGFVERRNDPDSNEEEKVEDLQDGLKIGRMIETALSADLTGKLSRYEMATQRQLDLTIKQLCELQKVRAMNAQKVGQPPHDTNDNEDDWEMYNGRRVRKIRQP